MNKKLSIIVPVYNVENYLDQCIASIINQDFSDFTLILVDDGSTDSSGIKCDQWKQKDDRIIVYHKPNGGLMSAWKYGLMRADTEYIGFVDSDDWIDPDMYSRLLQEAEKAQADIVMCGWRGESEEPGFQKMEKVKLEGNTFHAEEFQEKIYPIFLSGGDYRWMGISPGRWNKLFRREILLKNIRFCDERVTIGEDLLTTFLTVPNASCITIMKGFYPYHYRIHSESMIRKYSDENYKKIHLLYDCLKQANEQVEYDFSKQIHTYYIKLILAQLDNEMLFSGRTYPLLRKRMKQIYQSKRVQEAMHDSEMEKMPFKYRFYLKCLQFRWYALLFVIRKLKKI